MLLAFGNIPNSKVGLGAITGAVGGLGQWLVLRQRVQLKKTRWIVATAIGLGVGFALGVLLSGESPSTVGWYGTSPDNLGWKEYDTKVFAVAGSVLGLSQWLTLRRCVKRTGWLVVVGTLGGLVAGALEGAIMDDIIWALGHTTNNLGERLGGGLLFGLPVAYTVFGLFMGVALIVVLMQADWQQVEVAKDRSNSVEHAQLI
jgi:hypothetical protein